MKQIFSQTLMPFLDNDSSRKLEEAQKQVQIISQKLLILLEEAQKQVQIISQQLLILKKICSNPRFSKYMRFFAKWRSTRENLQLLAGLYSIQENILICINDCKSLHDIASEYITRCSEKQKEVKGFEDKIRTESSITQSELSTIKDTIISPTQDEKNEERMQYVRKAWLDRLLTIKEDLKELINKCQTDIILPFNQIVEVMKGRGLTDEQFEKYKVYPIAIEYRESQSEASNPYRP
jgi:hypothetical protein